jgi:Tol biopolymer transport system component
MALDMNRPFQHELYVMNTDGTNLTKFSNGSISQHARLSSDGQWIA